MICDRPFESFCQQYVISELAFEVVIALLKTQLLATTINPSGLPVNGTVPVNDVLYINLNSSSPSLFKLSIG